MNSQCFVSSLYLIADSGLDVIYFKSCTCPSTFKLIQIACVNKDVHVESCNSFILSLLVHSEHKPHGIGNWLHLFSETCLTKCRNENDESIQLVLIFSNFSLILHAFHPSCSKLWLKTDSFLLKSIHLFLLLFVLFLSSSTIKLSCWSKFFFQNVHNIE